MLPADDSAGWAVDASDVGDRGEKKGTSWPAVIEVFFQSRVKVAVRRRTRGEFAPSLVFGKPPKKSNVRPPLVLAPPKVGPNASRRRSDWRKPALKVPPDSPGRRGSAVVGRSRLSTAPFVLTTFSSASPDSRTWYLEPLSTFDCSRSSTFARRSSCSSTRASS